VTDVLRFILFAAALGLAAGLLLGGMALILAAPAHALEGAGSTRAVELSCLPVVRRVVPPGRLEM
jgi:hypothetical protein